MTRLALATLVLLLPVAVRAQSIRWVEPLPACRVAEWCAVNLVVSDPGTDTGPPTVVSETAALDVIDVRQGETVDATTRSWTVRLLPLAVGEWPLPTATVVHGPSAKRQELRASGLMLRADDVARSADARLADLILAPGHGVAGREVVIAAAIVGLVLLATAFMRRRLASLVERWRVRRRWRRTLRSLTRLKAPASSSTDVAAAVTAIWSIVRGFVKKEIGIPADAMSSTEIVRALRNRTDEARLRRLASSIDPVLFGARTMSAGDLAQILDDAIQLVTDLRPQADRA